MAPRQSLAILDLIAGGDYPDLVAAILDNQGGDIDWVHPETGLPLLHYAVGLDRAGTVRKFIERGAKVGPDTHGRWPSILALQCECSDEVCDLIEEAEAKIERKPSQSAAYWFSIEIPEAIPMGQKKLAREIGSDAEVSLDPNGTVHVTAKTVEALSEALNIINYMFDLNLTRKDIEFKATVRADRP